ncbi:MAG: hypothetical protein HY908_20370 [Myxococcales bacterium]|nr:hypothetical protein [Myxococcales bacterium]
MATLLVGNQLVDSDPVVLTRIDIAARGLDGATLLETWHRTDALVPGAPDGASVGYGIATATVPIDPDLAGLSGTVVVELVLTGQSVRGVPAQSAPYQFPLRIESIDCLAPKEPTDPLHPVCILGQDAAPDCRCVGPAPPQGCVP